MLNVFSNYEFKNKQILTTKILLDDYPFQPQKLEIKIDIPKSFFQILKKADIDLNNNGGSQLNSPNSNLDNVCSSYFLFL